MFISKDLYLMFKTGIKIKMVHIYSRVGSRTNRQHEEILE